MSKGYAFTTLVEVLEASGALLGVLKDVTNDIAETLWRQALLEHAYIKMNAVTTATTKIEIKHVFSFPGKFIS